MPTNPALGFVGFVSFRPFCRSERRICFCCYGPQATKTKTKTSKNRVCLFGFVVAMVWLKTMEKEKDDTMPEIVSFYACHCFVFF